MSQTLQLPSNLDRGTNGVTAGLYRSVRAAFRTGESKPAITRRKEALLSGTIEAEIVPRLVLANACGGAAAAAPELLHAEQVRELTALVLAAEFEPADVTNRLDLGMEDFCLELLAPVARELGAMWADDTADFLQVTVGMGRLQRMLTVMSAPLEAATQARRILIVPGPGDQHTFGMSMVASFFQRAGWGGWSGVPESPADLLGRVRGEWFAVIGFSVSCAASLDALAAAIRAVRKASLNPDIGIMVGGPSFSAHPELAAMVGADTTAVDGRQAVAQANRLLSLKPNRG